MIASRTTLRARFLPAVAALVVVCAAPHAVAGDEAAAAEVLFGEGKALVQAGDYASACPKFEESQKLDPGMGTLYRLADCYEHIGRTASAWAAFLEVAASAKTSGQQARADDAKQRAGALEPRLARLRIRVAEPELAGLVVKRGDVEVGRAQWNTPMPVDPGSVAVEASAPGRKTWRGTVTVGARSSSQIDVPALEREALEPPTATTGSTGLSSTDGDATTESALGTQRTLAIVSGALGVVGLGVGVGFGLVSMSKKSDADERCDANNACDDAGLALRRDAIDAGTISTVGVLAGGALLGAGVVLWITAPGSSHRTTGSRSPTTPTRLPRAPRATIAPRFGGLTFRMELP